MNKKEFNKKYGLSNSLVEGSLKKYIPQESQVFNNIAGKPKKYLFEMAKRFFSNWVVVLSTIAFLIVLLMSLIISTTPTYSSTKPINGDISIFLLDGSKYNGGSSSFVRFLPPGYSPLVNSTLFIGNEEYLRNINLWNDPTIYGGYIFSEVFGGANKGFFIEGNELLVDAYRWYEANTMFVLLENSSEISRNASFEQTAAAVTKLRELNPQINLSVLLGTNSIGVDIWTSSWVGTWNAIRLAIIVATIQTIIGVSIGSYLGFHVGSWIDTIMMRIIDIITAPSILIWLLIFASLFGTSDLSLGISLIVVGWPGSVGRSRTFIITVKDEEYITASKSIGVSKVGLVYRHALPAIIGKIATSYVASIPGIIVWVSSLAFLGFVQEGETASLGVILSSAPSQAGNNFWILLLPSLILLTISVSLHFVALGIHDALDPKVIKVK